MNRTGSKSGGTRSYEPVRLELDPDPVLDRIKADESPKPKTFFQRVQQFFQPVLAAFANAFSSARNAILSVFRGRQTAVDPLMYILKKEDAPQDPSTENPTNDDSTTKQTTVYDFSADAFRAAADHQLIPPVSTLAAASAPDQTARAMPVPPAVVQQQGMHEIVTDHSPNPPRETSAERNDREKRKLLHEAEGRSRTDTPVSKVESHEIAPEPGDQASRRPPQTGSTRPAPSTTVEHWRTMLLQKIPSLSDQQRSRIGAQLGMKTEEIDKAFIGLLSLAELSAEISPAGRATNVESLLNYNADTARRSEAMRDALEMASHLIKKIASFGSLPLDRDLREFFEQMNSVIHELSSALNKKLQELLPKNPALAKSKPRVPLVTELSVKQARNGSELFDQYVKSYMKSGDLARFEIFDGSVYFDPECLAYAVDFTKQVRMLPKEAEVDTQMLMASLYLISEARRRAVADIPD